MHENRETSGAPRPERERGRFAKAQSHTADAHASEESDCAIVSMNQSNNEEERFSAESGERRARAKENIVQSNTDPTQSGTTESDYAAHQGQRQTKYPSANAGSRLKRWKQWEGPV